MVLNFTQNSRSSKMHPISEKNPNGWMASRLDSSAQRCVVGLPSRACWYEDLFFLTVSETLVAGGSRRRLTNNEKSTGTAAAAVGYK